MASRCYGVSFEGIEAREIDVQCQLSPGMPGFAIVGLPDKAVAESRERVRAAFMAAGLALPPKRVVINLAPADRPKEGAHFDLPIALALLAEMGVVPAEETAAAYALGELSLDGALAPVAGVLPAALEAASAGRLLICPAANGAEAAVVGDAEIAAAPSLVALINHMSGRQLLSRPRAAEPEAPGTHRDLADVKGQEKARRALEIAAAGGHNMLISRTQHPNQDSEGWLVISIAEHQDRTVFRPVTRVFMQHHSGNFIEYYGISIGTKTLPDEFPTLAELLENGVKRLKRMFGREKGRGYGGKPQTVL